MNVQGGLYNSALQAALSDEHEAIVQLLLEKGAISPGSSEVGPLSTIVENAIQVEF
ncbi:uncharacterized protein STEHIDRAFT_121509 [Stereum hirsutum FP-91666 SS1]|uniref:uncharacterized protein n=1 Tax=Stereum hirsutum (strain FP-91666) TaxID=721885 RepID=UPI000440D04B|nr:uncharacterized protein STEHIDRAFT_121509 [Stereum hirsutum FP-91666 SS1]EIM86618.1 hypothetical protein STEHIDRAFT_121509 [Stereum hirsutum FP-91666 SS1]